MDRRDFLAGLGFGGYSLVVDAESLGPAPVSPAAAQWQSHFDQIAPPQRRYQEAEPHMGRADLDTDILVAGGGLAGVCAAVSAARHGAKVVLAQDRSRLGGNSSSEVKMHVVGANSHKSRPGWREGGLLEEIRLDDAVNNPQRCWEMWDLLLYDKVIREPNITLLLETTVFHAVMENGRIAAVLARCDKSEHLYRIRAKLFLDCTGDSRLGIESGAEYRMGREARGEFGESLAPEKADEETLGSSILFTSKLHHRPMPFTPPAWARKVTKEALKYRNISSWEYGYWWIEWGGDRNTIWDNERIRFELLSIVMGIWDYIKNSGEHPESANWALDWVGMMPGKRGSRRLVGDHLVTQHDLERGAFPDAVAIGGWPMDDHPPGGFDRSDTPPAVQIKTKEVFNLPLRALYSRNVPNLMMAGRNISATHVAFTSTRVMGTCAVVGQAAGTAAACCVERGISPRELAADGKMMAALRQTLLRDDQTIYGLRNEDPADVARLARVSAGGEHGEAKAGLILNGCVRDIPKKEVHHWEGPMGPDGAWIELAWEKPRRIRQVRITFDSGFQRELTLTASDTINRGIVRAPQPETVKDYVVQVSGPSHPGPVTVAEIRGNHQRLRRHDFEPVEAARLRIHITATNGDDYARIFEVRCYA
ncbi:MAG: FAD-dependent oxidoreductase [Bryobacterales bacterium]|nr:FAD-dependent oxidoreductase [Bryobacterales bacterium]